MNLKRMIAYVQIYIHIRKGVEIDIVLRNQRDIFLLQSAYDSAVNWMEENNVKLSII